MSQSTLIVGGLFVLFIVYITLKGELSSYLAVFLGPVTAGGGTTGGSGAAATSAVSGALGMVQSVQNLLGGSGSGTSTDSQGVTTTVEGGQITDVSGGGDFGAAGSNITGGVDNSGTGGLY